MKAIPLKSIDFDDLENDPIYLSIVKESGEKVYGAKMDAVQVMVLNYSVGQEVFFGSATPPDIQKHYITEVTKIFIRNGKKHEIHLQLVVAAERPKRVLKGPDNS